LGKVNITSKPLRLSMRFVKESKERDKEGKKRKEKKMYIDVVASSGVFSSKISRTHLSAKNSIMGNKVVSHSGFSWGE
jgi:hypothetical protein